MNGRPPMTSIINIIYDSYPQSHILHVRNMHMIMLMHLPMDHYYTQS